MLHSGVTLAVVVAVVLRVVVCDEVALVLTVDEAVVAVSVSVDVSVVVVVIVDDADVVADDVMVEVCVVRWHTSNSPATLFATILLSCAASAWQWPGVSAWRTPNGILASVPDPRPTHAVL